MSNEHKKRQQIVVVGGGFGGIKAALELSRNKEFEVILVSDKETFRYNPTLYHTATGGLMRQSSIPLKNILEGGRIQFVLGTIVKLDRSTQSIELEDKKVIAYDTLVLGLGVVTNYFGIKGLSEYAYGITSADEVVRFKKRLHQQLTEKGKPDDNYLIIGAGPSGVELAGALPAYLKEIIKKHGLPPQKVNVKLIEAAPRVLPRSVEAISKAVTKRLEKLDVTVMTGRTVSNMDDDSLLVGADDIPSQTVVWTAGAANHAFFKNNKFNLTERGKVAVNNHLLAEDRIYVVGDNADTPYSGLAQTAVYDGHYVARDIEAKFHGNEGQAYRPKSPATVIPVGSGWAAFEWKKLYFTGWPGWFLRQAADWIGYHDLEPWWKASQQWLTEFGEEEDCVDCR